MRHALLIDRDAAIAVVSGEKRAEVRKLDRTYSAGDTLLMRCEEIDGGVIYAQITHIQEGYGIPDGYGVLSIEFKDVNATPAAKAQRFSVRRLSRRTQSSRGSILQKSTNETMRSLVNEIRLSVCRVSVCKKLFAARAARIVIHHRCYD